MESGRASAKSTTTPRKTAVLRDTTQHASNILIKTATELEENNTTAIHPIHHHTYINHEDNENDCQII